MHSSQSDDGRRAMAAYRRQRELAFAAPAKLDYLEHLLHQHRDDRAILFTQDNATAYAVVASLPRPGHHPSDEGARAERDPRAASPQGRTARSPPRRC